MRLDEAWQHIQDVRPFIILALLLHGLHEIKAIERGGGSMLVLGVIAILFWIAI